MKITKQEIVDNINFKYQSIHVSTQPRNYFQKGLIN